MQQKNKIKCHSKLDLESSTPAVTQQQQQRPAWKILKQVQDDGLICYNNNAFTLIELLVVVLIIGILAAGALPQYQKAVEKSKATQALTALHALIQAQQAYHMANGTYAKHFDELDLELPWTGNETWAQATLVDDTRSNGEWSLQLWGGTNGPGYSGIYLGRLAGKYKGGGFVYYFESQNSFPNNQILCAERKNQGTTFTAGEGSYCQQIFRGTPVTGDSNVRLYRMQ